mmetsp:Transcript_1091/g.969  ORF Transcript_1091/g.969 Transcript_1091/m.969 type:complete len:145 (+) Transcript_1091:231-665(+)
MVVNNAYISRENIIPYFKEVTNINSWLTVPQLRTLEWYEHLIVTKLHLVTRILFFSNQQKISFSIFNYVHSPVRTYYKDYHLKNFINCCSSTIGCSNSINSIHCYDICTDIYSKLSEKLGENEYFFEKEPKYTKQLSSLDLTVY